MSIAPLVENNNRAANLCLMESKRPKDALLTEENHKESNRLKSLYNSVPHRLSQAAFGATYAIGNQGAVWQCLNAKGMPISLNAAQGFAKGLGVEIADFSPRLAALAQGIAKSVRSLPAEGNTAPAQIGARRIPLIDYVQAGVWTAVASCFQPGDVEDWLLTDLDLSGKAFALQIKGDSMRPDFSPGDRVIIDPDVQPQAGDLVVAKNGEEEATFKKYRVRGIDTEGNAVFELVPLNADFETLRSDEQQIRIVGVMVEHRKYRRKR